MQTPLFGSIFTIIMMVTPNAAIAAASSNDCESILAPIVGTSPQIAKVLQLATRVAKTSSTVLIHGETGSGKEIIARYIHENSLRKNGPFVAINCGAIPENLIESELFGHIKGSFTGAASDNVGLIASANGGTLFLDEIGDLPIHLQVKLLRVIQERMVRAVGSTRAKPIDVRIISATHRKLELAVREGKFRQDLLYRLAVIPIYVPPLRKRTEDIDALAAHILTRLGAINPAFSASFDESVMQILRDYSWPGNVRELENVIERAVVLAGDEPIQPSHIQFGLGGEDDSPTPPQPIRWPSHIQPWRIDDFVNYYIHFFIEKLGNITEVSRAIGIDRGTMHRRFKKIDVAVLDTYPGADLVRAYFESLRAPVFKEEQLRTDYIIEVLRLYAGNRSKAAVVLGVDRRTVMRFLSKSRIPDGEVIDEGFDESSEQDSENSSEENPTGQDSTS